MSLIASSYVVGRVMKGKKIQIIGWYWSGQSVSHITSNIFIHPSLYANFIRFGTAPKISECRIGGQNRSPSSPSSSQGGQYRVSPCGLDDKDGQGKWPAHVPVPYHSSGTSLFEFPLPPMGQQGQPTWQVFVHFFPTECTILINVFWQLVVIYTSPADGKTPYRWLLMFNLWLFDVDFIFSEAEPKG